MQWHIEYFNEKIEDEISQLPPVLLARYIRMTELMQDYGPHLGMPHTKALKNGLFELRLKAQTGIARVFYCISTHKKITILHVIIKKTSKIPLKELLITTIRLKKVKNEEKSSKNCKKCPEKN